MRLNYERVINSGSSQMVASRIEICNLLLRNDRPIPAELQNFLTNKGMVVEIIESGSQKLVKLTGNFTLTREEVNKFLNENFDKISDYYDCIPEVITGVINRPQQPPAPEITPDLFGVLNSESDSDEDFIFRPFRPARSMLTQYGSESEDDFPFLPTSPVRSNSPETDQPNQFQKSRKK